MPPKFEKRRSWSATKSRAISIDSIVAELQAFNALRGQSEDWKKHHFNTIMQWVTEMLMEHRHIFE